MLSGKQCLVTGGTGFMGRHLVRALLQRGARVQLLCRTPKKASDLFGDQVAVLQGDLLDTITVREADIVFHLGATYRFGRGARREMYDTNVGGTERLLQAAWQARVEKFVLISSSSVLANRRAPITERDVPVRVPESQPYRRSKWLAEKACLEFAARGLPVVITNPNSPIGPEDETPTPTGRMIVDFLRDGFPCAARTTLNFVDVSELADGLIAAAERGRTGERYVLAHHNVWLIEFLQLLARITGRSAPRFCAPWPFIALGGAFGELTGSDRSCWETAWHCLRRQPFDGRKANEELGWRPRVSLETSARAAVAWYQNHRSPAALVEANAAVS